MNISVMRLFFVSMVILVVNSGCASMKDWECTNLKCYQKGALAGMAAGAAAGAAIGYQSGEEGEGAALGAVTGMIIGGIAGKLLCKEQVTAKAEVIKDSDHDGIPDDLDKCPDTPRGVKVDQRGCPLDSDGDGVYDYLDKCSGTPKAALVDDRGCWVLKGVYFDTNKYNIEPRFYPAFDAIVSVLKKNPSLKIEVQGHTDNRGLAEYNLKLSENRAKAVRDYFIKAGIAESRLKTRGYGLTKPAVPNTSPENWAKNRRVELKPVL